MMYLPIPTSFNDKIHSWRRFIDCLCGALAIGVITIVSFQCHFPLPTPTLLFLLVIVLLALRGSFRSSVVVSIVATGCLIYFFVPPLFTFKIVTIVDFVAISVFIIISAIITHLISKVRQLMQDKLQQSETYLSEAQRLSRTGSFGWKISTGEVVWSEETFRILAYNRGTRPALELFLKRVHPDDALRVRQIFGGVEHNAVDFQVEVRLLLPDGSIKFIRLVAHAIRQKSREFEFVGALNDITERRNAEDALHKAQAGLFHATRLTIMGEPTASMAHEVNQSMAAVVTNANAGLRCLERKTPNIIEARDAFRRIVVTANRSSEVIAQVRKMTTNEPPAGERLDVNEVVRETVALAHLDLRKGQLTMDLMDGLPKVRAARMQLQQVLFNLLLNAVDAMETVTDRACVLRIETRNQGSHAVRIAVSDSGIGIDARQRGQVFETLYTAKPDGMGPGLSICRSIVEAHGGHMWVEPGPLYGTTFHFTLPNKDDHA